MQNHISRTSIGIRFGFGVRLYKKHHASPAWQQKNFILKLFAIRFLAFLGLPFTLLMGLVETDSLFWSLPFILLSSLLYGFWAERYFHKRMTKTDGL